MDRNRQSPGGGMHSLLGVAAGGSAPRIDAGPGRDGHPHGGVQGIGQNPLCDLDVGEAAHSPPSVPKRQHPSRTVSSCSSIHRLLRPDWPVSRRPSAPAKLGWNVRFAPTTKATHRQAVHFGVHNDWTGWIRSSPSDRMHSTFAQNGHRTKPGPTSLRGPQCPVHRGTKRSFRRYVSQAVSSQVLTDRFPSTSLDCEESHRG